MKGDAGAHQRPVSHSPLAASFSIAEIVGEIPTAAPAWVVERLPADGSRESERSVWMEAMRRPGLIAPAVQAQAE